MTNKQITVLSMPQVQQLIGLSKSIIYAMIKTGQFKAPIKLGLKTIGWLESDIDEFIAKKIELFR
jgi:prophage regulatory protein